MKKNKVLIIGGGIGGLATAALLARDNFQVTLVEKNKIVGGRARFLKLGNFYFDMGPSWYMMPEVFDRYFALFGKKTSDFYQLKKLKTHYRVFFEDGDYIDVKDDLKENLKIFKKYEKNGEQKLNFLINQAKYIYNFSMKDLVYLSYKNINELLRPKIIFNIHKLNLFQSLHSHIQKIIKNPKLQKIIEYTTVFLGGSPFNTPAFYQLVLHADLNLGIYYPKGGIYKIIEALQKLCLDYGVNIITNEEVSKVFIKNKKIIKVKTNQNKQYYADIFIVNADYPFFETNLLPKTHQTYSKNYWQKKTFSPSAFLIYLGIKDDLKFSQHHNLYFTDNWQDHFRDVYQKKEIPTNPSFYYHVPSKTDSSMAPKNHHSVMILVPMPPNFYLDNKETENFYKKVINKFASINKIKNINDKIVVKKIFHATNFLEDYNSYFGSAFGIAHTLFQTALFRPKNFSSKIENLFYVGQHTNPGVGMPPVLISSQIVHNLVKKYEQSIRKNN